VNRVDALWPVGRWSLGTIAALFARLRVYGKDRIPPTGGVVLALNHFSWIDIPLFAFANPRNTYFVAKIEAHQVPGMGQFIRAFGSFSIRRGESDREAVRRMREVVREGSMLGVFAEGTRQRSGVPGQVQPGAAMVALQEDVPLVCGAIEGSLEWRLGNFAPVSVAWGEPMRFEGLPRGAKGYREASHEIRQEIRRLWDWLRDVRTAGRPRTATPPQVPERLRTPVTLPR
jgi:1-acyl-sn-glycerol-3-phosphate acyltransferase